MPEYSMLDGRWGWECEPSIVSQRDWPRSKHSFQNYWTLRMETIAALDAGTSLDAMALDMALSFLDMVDVDDSDAMFDALLDDDSPPILEPLSAHFVSHVTAQCKDVVSSTENVGTDGDVNPPIPAHSSGAPKGPLKARVWRDKRKQEKEYLRAQVEQLEAELQQLKNSPRSNEATVWAKVAKRQGEEKQRAVVENAWLREQLEDQLKLARSLERVLSKRAICDSTDDFRQRKRHCDVGLLEARTTLVEIRGRIRSQFGFVDAVIHESGLADIHTDLEDIRATTRSTSDGTVCIEMIVAKVYPFTVEQVANAMWQCLGTNRIELHNGYFSGSQRSADMCDLNFVIEMNLRRSDVLVRAHGVASRRMEPERTFIVSETSGVAEGELFDRNTLHCRQRRYVAIEKNPMGGHSIDSPSTIVRICACTWPEKAEGIERSTQESLRVESVIDLLIGCNSRHTKKMLQYVENILVRGHSLG